MASPPHFYRIAAILIPWFMVPALLLIAYGTYAGLFLAPMDYQQGDAFRIIYVHVPSAWLSMFAYVVMATSAAVGLIWHIKLCHSIAAAAARPAAQTSMPPAWAMPQLSRNCFPRVPVLKPKTPSATPP